MSKDVEEAREILSRFNGTYAGCTKISRVIPIVDAIAQALANREKQVREEIDGFLRRAQQDLESVCHEHEAVLKPAWVEAKLRDLLKGVQAIRKTEREGEA